MGCPKWITGASLTSMQIQIDCPLEYTKPMLLFLRNHQHSFFQQMDMLAVADHIGEPMRFELSYGLRNVMYWNNIRCVALAAYLCLCPCALCECACCAARTGSTRSW